MYWELFYVFIVLFAIIILDTYDSFLSSKNVNNFSFSKNSDILFVDIEDKTKRKELLDNEALKLKNMSLTDKFYYFLNRDGIIAHAGGEIDGVFYTNSFEALENSYKRGIRIFEIDFTFTKDNHLVLAHGFEFRDYVTCLGIKYDGKGMDYNTFMNTKLHGKYTTMDIEALIAFMRTHKDVYIIPDIKKGDNVTIVKEAYRDIVKAAKYDRSVLDRFAGTFLSSKTYNAVRNIYNFKIKIIHNRTLNKLEKKYNTIDKLVAYAKYNGIKTMAMSYALYTEEVQRELAKNNINVILFTLDKKVAINNFRKIGATAIMSNNVSPIPFEHLIGFKELI